MMKEMRKKVKIVLKKKYGQINKRKKIGDVMEEKMMIKKNMQEEERR